jgi:hypothetical protein
MAKVDFFIEAHYYSGGLRHQHFPLEDARPVWAPPPGLVGFTDEFQLDGDALAVEWCRSNVGGERTAWIAIYGQAVDAEYGDRKNHAGFGIWIRGHNEFDAEAILKSLDVVFQNSTLPLGRLENDVSITVYKFAQWLDGRFIPMNDIWKGPEYGSGSIHTTAEFRAKGGVEGLSAVGQHINTVSHCAEPMSTNRMIFAIGNTEKFATIAEMRPPSDVRAEQYESIVSSMTSVQLQLDRALQQIDALQSASAAASEELVAKSSAIAASAVEIEQYRTRLASYENSPRHVLRKFIFETESKLAQIEQKFNEMSSDSSVTIEDIILKIRTQEALLRDIKTEISRRDVSIRQLYVGQSPATNLPSSPTLEERRPTLQEKGWLDDWRILLFGVVLGIFITALLLIIGKSL